MPTSILATKLYVPHPRSTLVARLRLIERLNKGLHRRLTLIAAPAGFGKTTLLSEWLEGGERPAAWLSLDEGDSDLAHFLTYLIAALQTIAAEIGAAVLPALDASPPMPMESVLTSLINDIAATPNRFILVLDDYHLAGSPPIDEALTFLLEHLPPQMHLAITTREDPNLPLARLRARDQLTELRVADLRFTPGEAAEFLNQVMALNLSAEEVATLETRTEGWIAGLQLAALSMHTHQDVAGFIQAFAGSHRYIMDYLVEEVLKRQPQPVRDFLLQTAILDRLNGPLCDAVTGQAGGRARLEALQRGNFFVVPLDDHRHWYRFHHLFGEVLRAYLMAEPFVDVSVLHRRASQWYEQNGSPAEAIHHALAGGEFERAADLVEQAAPVIRRGRQEASLLGWLRRLPEAVIRQRPALCNVYAGALLQNGEPAGVEAWLQAAENGLEQAYLTTADRDRPTEPASARVIEGDEGYRRLAGSIAIHRAGQALMLGRVADTIHHARRALDLVPEDDHLGRGAGLALLGLASWTNGDLDAARRLYAGSLTRLLQAGHAADALGLSISLADILLAQGHLGEARHTYERGFQLVVEQGRPMLRGAADMLVGLSEIDRERNEFQAARQHLASSDELGDLKALAQNPYRRRVVLARIRAAQGDVDEALDLLNEAERLYMGDFSPNVRPVAALRARLAAAHGRLAEALAWARARGLSPEDDLDYLREYEHVTLVRVRLAQHQGDNSDSEIGETLGLLERLLAAAEAGGRTGSVIELLILQALALQMTPHPAAALEPLARALRLAEPEGYIRLFVDEGRPMARLLRAAAGRELLPQYTAKLLEAFPREQLLAVDGAPPAASPARVAPAKPAGGLVEPLSERELDVLRLFRTELSGPEIAGELMIALSTVRTHTKSIFSKLNVNSRRAAVRRARELGLI
jgi:LuxR family maltose regulon positive regulatory protein